LGKLKGGRIMQSAGKKNMPKLGGKNERKFGTLRKMRAA